MRYHSTRDDKKIVFSKEAILKGISEDGGLFVPEEFPKLNIENCIDFSYKELAYEVLKKYLTDYTEDELKTSIEEAYSHKFIEDVAPLVKVGDVHYLELYHGPTLAFKDFALMILPKLMGIAKKSLGDYSKTLILTATSGDTGKAALEGFSDMENIDIIVFYPKNGVSKIQELQMVTTTAENVSVMGIEGNFDDAQSGVKAIFNDAEFNRVLAEKNVKLSSANSINIGRLLPQIVYYFYAYGTLRRRGEIKANEKISFSVPTGNFGDVLAGFYAKEMGLPIDKLIVSSNENKVLTDFFETGVYDGNRKLKVTNSPSMDIIISSNLERLLYHKIKSVEEVKNLEWNLESDKKFNADIEFDEFYSGYCSECNTLLTIDTVFKEYNYLMDTHTAVARYVGDKYKSHIDGENLVVLSTASPYKFPHSVGRALGLRESTDEFDEINKLSELSNVKIPESLQKLKSAKIIHNKVIDKSEMRNAILEFIGDKYE